MQTSGAFEFVLADPCVRLVAVLLTVAAVDEEDVAEEEEADELLADKVIVEDVVDASLLEVAEEVPAAARAAEEPVEDEVEWLFDPVVEGADDEEAASCDFCLVRSLLCSSLTSAVPLPPPPPLRPPDLLLPSFVADGIGGSSTFS